MHAFQPSSLPPTRRSRSIAPQRRVHRHPHRSLAIEATIKLTVNLVLSGVSIAALAQLLPYRAAQETRLQEIQAAVQSANGRTQQNQAKFGHYFDPAQSRSLMQQHSNRIEPGQRPIVWQEPQPRATSTAGR
ncbi:MAG TPA: hypothetical protein V6D18_09350 [Thermosynechococcaceae cyanobacterium]